MTRREHLLGMLAGKEVDSPCPHFAQGCGGCALQHAPYGEQLRAKAELLGQEYGEEVPIVPCPDPLGYRNRMDFVCAFGKKGLRVRSRFAQVVDVEDCLLLPEHARRIWQLAREALSDVEGYNYIRQTGFLRYVVIRTSRSTKETMLVVTTRSPETREERLAFQDLLSQLASRTGASSLHWTVNDSQADISVGGRSWHIGNEWIIDEVADCRFRVYPETFFQANTLLAGPLFRKAVSHARGRVLDLYSGVGTLAILAALQEQVDRVLGVEIVKESVEAAKENAILNGIPLDKCRFLCDDAALYLRLSDERFDTVMCDPARAGLEKALDALLAHAPERIIYVSCNTHSHRADLARLKTCYDVSLLEAYDLFPQTPHVEILSVLERR